MNPYKQNIFYKDLTINLTACRVSSAGEVLCLTPGAFALLAVLLSHCCIALSRSQLPEAAWG